MRNVCKRRRQIEDRDEEIVRLRTVLPLDDEAYHAMVELNRGLSEEQTARRVGIPAEAVHELVGTLRRIKQGGDEE